MLTIYPDLPVSLGADPKPFSQAKVTNAPNGRTYVQHLAVHNDASVKVLHEYISLEQIEQLLRFYDDNRGLRFLWRREYGGISYEAEFVQRPVPEHVSGPYWNITSELIVREEGSV